MEKLKRKFGSTSGNRGLLFGGKYVSPALSTEFNLPAALTDWRELPSAGLSNW